MLLRTFSSAFIMLNFIANQDYIERTFCVNKNIPNSRCHGHCHLKKQLEQEEQSNKSNPLFPSIGLHDYDLFYQNIRGLQAFQFADQHQRRILFIENVTPFCTLDLWRRNRSP